jgi:outer membrane protein TolC
MIREALLVLLEFAQLPLDRALQAAVVRSPEVAAANARVAEAAAAVDGARAVLVPALTGGYAQIPQGNPPGPAIVSRMASAGLQTNVADFLAYGPSVRQNVLLLESSRDDAAVAERSERLKTAGLYFDALKARAVVAARAKSLDLASAQRDAAQKRFAVGDGPHLDVVRADVAVARATADLETARGADADATNALALETGLSISDLAATADAGSSRSSLPASAPASATPSSQSMRSVRSSSLQSTQSSSSSSSSSLSSLSLSSQTSQSLRSPSLLSSSSSAAPQAGDPDADASVARALAGRAEIASALAAQHAQEAAERVAASGGFGSLTVGGGYTAGTDSGVPVGGPSVNVALTLPLGSGAQSRVRVESGKVAEARAKVEGVKRSVILEVGAAARDVGALRRAAEASTRGREAAEEELAATALGYRNGASSSLEVASAQTTYAQALVDESSALYDLAKGRLTLQLDEGR